VLDEVQRVLKLGGVLLFNTINRTPLAALVIVHLGETVFRLLPRGRHDPAKFIRPSELRARLSVRGLAVGPLVGLGPRGINRRLDFTFGRLPSVQIMYMGHALASVRAYATSGFGRSGTWRVVLDLRASAVNGDNEGHHPELRRQPDQPRPDAWVAELAEPARQIERPDRGGERQQRRPARHAF
jgi:hypothetical protein